MADYKRMISYLYQYEDGVKKKNVGYVRVEARNGQCKFTIHLQLLGQLDSIFPTYLIQRKKDEIELVYLGDALLKNQVMDSKLSAEEKDIMNSGHTLSDMGGLLIFLNEGIFFATEWDDKPVIAKEVLDALKPRPGEVKDPDKDGSEIVQVANTDSITKADKELALERNISKQVALKPDGFEQKQAEENFMTLEEELKIPKYKLPRGYKTIERLQGPMMTKEPELIEKLLEAADADVEEFDTPDMRMDTDHQTAKHFFDNYPRIYPFEDNIITNCVKIEPKDIGLLPKEIWALSNNSFLMHGYYCYHHLIFAKITDRSGYRYILGVPGIYHNREKFMARMFGFEEFKSIRKRELRQGDFGYWHLTINL